MLLALEAAACYYVAKFKKADDHCRGGVKMPYPIDQTSFNLGVIFAFAEMVAIDVKKMAFSLPFLPGNIIV